MPYLTGVVTPQDFGAVGNGTTDDTAAIQDAINYVAGLGGGPVFFPAATYAVTPAGAASAALVMNNGSAGYNGVRLVGASTGGSVLKKLAAGPIVAMAGPGTDTTGNTHAKYCSLEDIQLNGNGLSGTMVQCYYADNLVFTNVHCTSNADVVFDSAEFWDSRFYNLVVESSGSTTANASTPNMLLRCAAAASGFGATTDNVNQIHFVGCRWEAFKTGAVWVEQGAFSSNSPNGIFFTNCKAESSTINGGPHMLVSTAAKAVYVNHMYFYSGGFSSGYSTAQDVIQWGAQSGEIADVFIANKSGTSTVANGITLNSSVAGQNVVARNVTASYATASPPTGAHVNFGTATGGFIVDNCTANTGTAYGGTIPAGSNPVSGLMQVFTSSGTWTAPPGAVLVDVTLIGAGGGGGSGAVEASGTVASGGAGGGGGGFTFRQFPASALNSTETVTVGAGGAGGTAVGTAASNGNAGSDGGSTLFRANTFLAAASGKGGAGGTTGAATGGSQGNGSFNGGAGASSSATGAAGSTGTGVQVAGPGGGSGGGITTGAAASTGGAGGQVSSSIGNAGGTAGASGGGAGGAGTSVPANSPLTGTGGGGGGSSTTGNGGAGGAGGSYGAGGGGGGAALTGHSSGAGGAGAGGIAIVVTTCAT